MIEAIVIFALVALDQLVKYFVRTGIPLGETVGFIPHVLGLTHIHNTGAAFSMLEGGGARWFFVILTVAFVGAALWVLFGKKICHPLGTWSWVMLIAGAIGNLIDRCLFGYVVDMFEVLFFRFAIFNVADIFVVVGGILFCVYYLFLHDRKDKKEGPEQGEEETHDDSM